jgi:hypothetical protein
MINDVKAIVAIGIIVVLSILGYLQKLPILYIKKKPLPQKKYIGVMCMCVCMRTHA